MYLSPEATGAYPPPKQETTLKYSKMWNPEYWRSNKHRREQAISRFREEE